MKTVIFYGERSEAFQDALSIRHKVFTDEQGYAEDIDHDEIDAFATHVVMYEGTDAIATARMFATTPEEYQIGRVAVLKSHRMTGLGAKVMEALMDHLHHQTNVAKAVLHAQVPAIGFYEKLGYESKGEVYLEDGQPHQTMQKTFLRRGFEVARGFEEQPVIIPIRKTASSAGYDLATIEAVEIPAKSVVLVKTGLKAFMLCDEVLEIHIRSSVAVKQNVWCVNNVGIVDSDYYSNVDNDGHIMVPLYNSNDYAVTFAENERVAQAIFKKYLAIDGENFDGAIRMGGFGSTGK